jgi:hypothetical protein
MPICNPSTQSEAGVPWVQGQAGLQRKTLSKKKEKEKKSRKYGHGSSEMEGKTSAVIRGAL